jgi:hypothetical protein
VAIDSLNNIVMTGLLGDNVNLGTGTLSGGGIFLAKYSPSGVALWSENFPPLPGGSCSLENGNAVAVDGADNIAITGAVVGDVNLGGGVLPMASGDYNNNTYVAEYTSSGANLWAARFPNLIPPSYPGFNSGKAIGTDAFGSVITFGVFSDSINFGLGVLTNPGACGGSCGYGAYLAKFGTSSAPPTATPTAPAATATPTQTPTSVPPTATPTNTPTATPTKTPTNAPTNTPTPTPTNTPTNTSTPTPTNTPKNGPTNTPTPTPTPTPTLPPTSTPTPTPTPPPPPPRTSFFTVNPCRVIDTRNPDGPSGGPALSAGTSRTFPVAGLCGIPSTAKAVAINLGVVLPTDGGDLRLYPASDSAPMASTVNFKSGVVRANNGTVAMGSNGQITVMCDMLSGATDFFVDVFGYYQ